MTKFLNSFIGDLSDKTPAPWLTITGRLFLAAFLLAAPVIYDRLVPEVAGDMRWHFLHMTVGILIAVVALYYARLKRLLENFSKS